MAQLRQEYPQFTARGAEVVVIGPEGPEAFRQFWLREDMPFVGLADPSHVVARLYGQQVKLLRAGRMPALLVVDTAGRIRYAHYGASMQDIPPNSEILELLDQLNSEGSDSWNS